MILVVGATGRLGKAVAERLLQDGISFRAACRNVAKAQWLAERGVEVVPLDVENGAGLTAALSGITKVLTCIHGLLGKSRHSIQRIDVSGHERLIDASVEAGVERFVYVSALGAAPDHPSEFWRAKAQTEQHLRKSGLEFVILRPSAFMDLYAHDLIGAAILRGKRVFLLGSGNTPRNLVAVSDVAEAAVKALFRPDLAGQIIDFGGWDNLTEREVAKVYAGLAGREPKVSSVPSAILPALAASIAPFHAGFARIVSSPLLLAGRPDLCMNPTVAAGRLGIDPVRLAQFAQTKIEANAAALK
jgi:NADH dehydrogenase